MKLKENLVLRQVVDTWIVLPLSASEVNMNGMLKLNKSGVMLWRILEQGGGRDAMADALASEYGISREEALEDVDTFYGKLVKFGCAEEL